MTFMFTVTVHVYLTGMQAKKRMQEMTKRIFGGADLKFLMATNVRQEIKRSKEHLWKQSNPAFFISPPSWKMIKPTQPKSVAIWEEGWKRLFGVWVVKTITVSRMNELWTKASVQVEEYLESDMYLKTISADVFCCDLPWLWLYSSQQGMLWEIGSKN